MNAITIPFEDYRIEELIHLRDQLNNYINKKQNILELKTEIVHDVKSNNQMESGFTHAEYFENYTSTVIKSDKILENNVHQKLDSLLFNNSHIQRLYE
jgi:hypothetical protein